MTNLLELYVKLGGLVLVGFILGRKLPVTVPTRLGLFLFWVGVPISIVSFLRQSSLSGQIWIAPAIAYLAILLGAFLAWLAIKGQAYFRKTIPQPPTQASLILAAMLGNTGYLGFPITLAMVGKEYFAWALFYDLLGSFPGTYGLGVLLAAHFGGGVQNHSRLRLISRVWLVAIKYMLAIVGAISSVIGSGQLSNYMAELVRGKPSADVRVVIYSYSDRALILWLLTSPILSYTFLFIIKQTFSKNSNLPYWIGIITGILCLPYYLIPLLW
ncbi:AEC family transporter [Nostoc sp. DedQUE09]|uniref:AEC family transporter n=1 Tax=Nostoc sp. DedQUE09 TaxID=3075394 RepID=UPI002AD33826|nr:AEC family transporter [Nostoc sp. DedQUE09]MDZ7952416.1 hypothetical protein [Nostoc sp. DedQUE09]